MPVPSLQITLAISVDGTIKCETPGPNGARRKIDLDAGFLDRNPELHAEFLAFVDKARERAKAELRSVQNQNIQYVAQSRGMGLDFAAKIWHNGELAFNRAIGRKLAEAVAAQPTKKEPKPRKPATAGIAFDLGDDL
jgi:hypothetical protein